MFLRFINRDALAPIAAASFDCLLQAGKDIAESGNCFKLRTTNDNQKPVISLYLPQKSLYAVF